MPQLSSSGAAMRAAVYLCLYIRNHSPVPPIAHIRYAQIDSIKELFRFFSSDIPSNSHRSPQSPTRVQAPPESPPIPNVPPSIMLPPAAPPVVSPAPLPIPVAPPGGGVPYNPLQIIPVGHGTPRVSPPPPRVSNKPSPTPHHPSPSIIKPDDYVHVQHRYHICPSQQSHFVAGLFHQTPSAATTLISRRAILAARTFRFSDNA